MATNDSSSGCDFEEEAAKGLSMQKRAAVKSAKTKATKSKASKGKSTKTKVSYFH